MRIALVAIFLGLMLALWMGTAGNHQRLEAQRVEQTRLKEEADLKKEIAGILQREDGPVVKYEDEALPYACRRAHYDQATCEEQKRGNADMGRYLLSK